MKSKTNTVFVFLEDGFNKCLSWILILNWELHEIVIDKVFKRPAWFISSTLEIEIISKWGYFLWIKHILFVNRFHKFQR